MGAENKGEISLLILNVSLASIFSGLFGGPSLVYLIPRFPFKTLFSLNYGWSLITSLLMTLLIIIGFLPSTTAPNMFFAIALLECLVSVNMMILLGRNKITRHNLLLIIKSIILVGTLSALHLNGELLDYDLFEKAYFASMSIVFIVSLAMIARSTKSNESFGKSLQQTARESLSFGFLVQSGNIAQLLNYRLSFYFLELLIHPPAQALIRIGIYSATLQIAEALWQFARSVSTVQYAAVSNMENKSEGLSVSLRLGKLNYSVTIIGILLLLIPGESFYSSLLGGEFGEVKTHLYFLAPGIVALSLSNAFSHYFAGVGLHRFNTQSSVFGLILSVILGYFAILEYGTLGAAAVASLVYVSQTLYQFIMLQKQDNVKWNALMLQKKDIKAFSKLWQNRF